MSKNFSKLFFSDLQHSSVLRKVVFAMTHGEKGGALFVVLAFILGIVSLVAVLLFVVFGKVVRPDEIGIRENAFAAPPVLQKGFEVRGLRPGLHWQVPQLSKVITIPRRFQLIHLNRQPIKGDLSLPPLEVQTADGSKVITDVTIAVRFSERPDKTSSTDKEFDWIRSLEQGIEKGEQTAEVPLAKHLKYKNGGPKNLINEYFRSSSGSKSPLEAFVEGARSKIRERLTRLSTIDFYSPSKRETAAILATADINKSYAKHGIEVWGVLIRRYNYQDRNIDDQIFKKNLQEQTEHLNAALGELAAARASTVQHGALWDAKIRDLEVEGNSRVQVIKSEGDLYEASKRAEGDLLVATAQAEVDRKKASALTDVKGSEVYIAREMAPLLKTLSGGVVSGLDPYDINKWLYKLLPRDRRRAGK